jgi:hypothetical protein
MDVTANFAKPLEAPIKTSEELRTAQGHDCQPDSLRCSCIVMIVPLTNRCQSVHAPPSRGRDIPASYHDDRTSRNRSASPHRSERDTGPDAHPIDWLLRSCANGSFKRQRMSARSRPDVHTGPSSADVKQQERIRTLQQQREAAQIPTSKTASAVVDEDVSPTKMNVTLEDVSKKNRMLVEQQKREMLQAEKEWQRLNIDTQPECSLLKPAESPASSDQRHDAYHTTYYIAYSSSYYAAESRISEHGHCEQTQEGDGTVVHGHPNWTMYTG